MVNSNLLQKLKNPPHRAIGGVTLLYCANKGLDPATIPFCSLNYIQSRRSVRYKGLQLEFHSGLDKHFGYCNIGGGGISKQ